MNPYCIEHMSLEEVELAMEWAAQEGWNPGLDDAACFYHADPNGFFAGKLNNTIIAVGSAVIYDENFAFCGLYMVDKAFREQGYGILLTQSRLNYAGDRNVGIDGVLKMCPRYERLGYRFAHQNVRYRFEHLSLKTPTKSKIFLISPKHFKAVVAYDRIHFPAERSRFLKHWLYQPHGMALVYLEEDIIKGYGVIRQCLSGFKIGPLFADTPAIADTLFTHLAVQAKEAPIYLDAPEVNQRALILTHHYKGQRVFETARMYLKYEPPLPLENIYGVTTFELG